MPGSEVVILTGWIFLPRSQSPAGVPLFVGCSRCMYLQIWSLDAFEECFLKKAQGNRLEGSTRIKRMLYIVYYALIKLQHPQRLKC